MKTFKVKPVIYSFVFAIVLMSCGSGNQQKQAQEPVYDHHSSRLSLDWKGVYRGILPCADCEGIETRIALKPDGTFQRSMNYLGKENGYFTDESDFVWDESGNKITLKAESGDQKYQVGENVLFHLDREGNRITGELAELYKLLKNRVDPRLEDKEWVLIELRGKPVEADEMARKGFIIFSMETGTFSGNNTCNNVFGNYELMEVDRIKFGPTGTTRMACPGNEAESLFMEVLLMADNYTIVDNELSLNNDAMAPLARFKSE